MNIKLEDTRRIIAGAETKAAQIGQPMNIAVRDPGGNLVSHAEAGAEAGGEKDFDPGASKKFVLNPERLVS